MATRTFSELILNRDQEWGELVLYASFICCCCARACPAGPVQVAP